MRLYPLTPRKQTTLPPQGRRESGLLSLRQHSQRQAGDQPGRGKPRTTFPVPGPRFSEVSPHTPHPCLSGPPQGKPRATVHATPGRGQSPTTRHGARHTGPGSVPTTRHGARHTGRGQANHAPRGRPYGAGGPATLRSARHTGPGSVPCQRAGCCLLTQRCRHLAASSDRRRSVPAAGTVKGHGPAGTSTMLPAASAARPGVTPGCTGTGAAGRIL